MPNISVEHQNQMLQILQSEGLVDPTKLQEAIATAETANEPIIEALVRSGLVDIEAIVQIEAMLLNVPYANISDFVVDPEVLKIIPNSAAERSMAVPLSLSASGRLSVAMIDANNIQAIDYLTSLVKKPLKVYMASEQGIRHILEQYGTDFSSVNKAAAV